jgi:hypothetical protein
VDLRKLLIATQITFGMLASLLWAAAVAGAASVGLIVAVNASLSKTSTATAACHRLLAATKKCGCAVS